MRAPLRRAPSRAAAAHAAPCALGSAVVGELDEDLDANLDLTSIRAPPLKTIGCVGLRSSRAFRILRSHFCLLTPLQKLGRQG